MKKTLLIIQLDHRSKNAVNVQAVLTASGCFIKTRLGIHDGTPELCADQGLIILELVGKKSDHLKLEKNLKKIKGVKAKAVSLG
ncbi:MAG: hypothetical protein WC500_05550 [Candidatus Margulisiibacteriota bacterium]